MNNTTQYFWLEMVRADKAGHNSRNIEMTSELRKMGLCLTLITSYKNQPLNYSGFECVKVNQTKGIFRLHYMIKVFNIICSRLYSSNLNILIIGPESLYVAILIKWVSRIIIGSETRIHMDIRTVPVGLIGLRMFLVKLLFWRIPILFAARLVDSFSFITEPMRQASRLKVQDYCIWSSGVNIEKFANGSPYPGGFELLYLGSVGRERGVKEVITAISSAKQRLKTLDFKFHVVGHGDELDNLKKYASDMDVADLIRFYGYVHHDDVPLYLAKADFFICPLPNHPWWNESSPIKIYEYLATGKPVILTRMPAHDAIIKNKIPGIIPIDNLSSDSISNAFFKLSKEYKYYMQHSKSRIEYASNFTWRNQALILKNFLEKKYSI